MANPEQIFDVATSILQENIIPDKDPLVEAVMEGYMIDEAEVITVEGMKKDGIRIPTTEVKLYAMVSEEGKRELYRDVAYDLEGPLVG